MMQNKVIVFDLEDTLYKEVDFLKSGYRAVADYLTVSCCMPDLFSEMIGAYQEGENDVFQKILDNHHLNITKEKLIDVYRYHLPQIQLDDNVKSVLEQLQTRCHLALITDGRTRTKMNIITALGLSEYFRMSDIYISEEVGHLKTAPYSFEKIMEKYPGCHYVYVGDNTEKDFLMPNLLGWNSFCLMDDGQHIHQQDFTLDTRFLPIHIINHIIELLNYV